MKYFAMIAVLIVMPLFTPLPASATSAPAPYTGYSGVVTPANPAAPSVAMPEAPVPPSVPVMPSALPPVFDNAQAPAAIPPAPADAAATSAAPTATPAAAPAADPCAAYAAAPGSYALCTDRMKKIQRMLDAKKQRAEDEKPKAVPAAVPADQKTPATPDSAATPAEGSAADKKSTDAHVKK